MLMQLLDGGKSLHQLRKGRGDGAPALYGFIELVHLGKQDRARGDGRAKYTLTASLGWGRWEALPYLSW